MIAPQTNEHRTRPMITLTISNDARERLDVIADRLGVSRSAAVERLVREAEIPRPQKKG
jgi:hypothetical protein